MNLKLPTHQEKRDGLKTVQACWCGREKGSDRFESKHRRKDGTLFDIEVSLQFRPEEGGQGICFIRDITDQKNDELALRESEEKLRQAQKMEAVGRLAGGIAHDFNNMLSVIIGTGHAEFDGTYCAEHPGFLPGEYVLLAVSDNGSGMATETLDNIFEPFFTTKEIGAGTGLGLATVYGIVKQNNGFINVYSEQGHGTTFKIYLPRHRPQADGLPEKEKVDPAKRGHETILLVEDEPAILRMTTIMLEKLGYQVVTAGTPGEAIHLAREHVGKIDLLVSDVVMPEMNGRDLARNILSLHPHLKRLFMSGYTANAIAHHGVLDAGVNFIQKPFSKESLGRKVREALDKD